MTEITISELQANVGKYVAMAKNEHIAITRNGKIVAKLVGDVDKEIMLMDKFDEKMIPTDKKDALRRLVALFPEGGLDLDPEKVKEERLKRKADPD